MVSKAAPNMLMRFKSRIVRIAGPLGMYALAKAATRSEPRILMYHRFRKGNSGIGVPAETFQNQVRLLNRSFKIITLADLAGRIEANSVEPGLAVITIDDGYRDFFDVAYPVLKREGVPATFFVTTDFIDSKLVLWPDVLKYLMASTTDPRAVLDSAGIRSSLVERNGKTSGDVIGSITHHLLCLTTKERYRYLKEIATALNHPWPLLCEPHDAPVSWGQLRQMLDSGIEIGAHSVTHPRLTCESDEDLKHEIERSKERIEQELGIEVTSFCYPNGTKDDYDGRVVNAVRSAGFRCAVAAHSGSRRGSTYALCRLGVDENMFQFRKSIAGVEHVRQRLSGIFG